MRRQREVEGALVHGNRKICHRVFLLLQERIRVEGFLAQDRARGVDGGEMREGHVAGRRARPRTIGDDEMDLAPVGAERCQHRRQRPVQFRAIILVRRFMPGRRADGLERRLADVAVELHLEPVKHR